MTTPAHKPTRTHGRPNNANTCDVCHTAFIGARQLVTHLSFNPSHVRSIDLSGARADASYRSIGR